MSDCPHTNLQIKCKYSKLEQVGRYVIEVAARCADCFKLFQFHGLDRSAAINLDGASASPNGIIAKLTVSPEDQALPDLSGLRLPPELQDDLDPTRPDFQHPENEDPDRFLGDVYKEDPGP